MMHNAPRWLASLLCAASLATIAPPPAHAKVEKELVDEATALITSGLKADDPLLKSYAILAAGELGDAKILKELPPFLASTNREVRQAAIVALLARKDKKAQEAFDQELSQAGAGAFQALTQMLPRLDEKTRLDQLKRIVIPGKNNKFSKELQDVTLRYLAEREAGATFDLFHEAARLPDADQARFVKALLANPRADALPVSQKLLADKKNAAARLRGLELARAIGDKTLDGAMREAVKDADPKVSAAALAWLEEERDDAAGQFLVGQLTGALPADLPALIDRALATGVKIPAATAQELLGEDKGGDEALTLRLYALLGATGEPASFEQLLKLEQSTLIEERRRGVYGLGYTDNPAAVNILARTINDGNADLRLYSARGLGLLNKPAAVTVLQKTLQRVGSGDKELTYAILEALARTDDPAAAKVLMFKASDPDPRVKQAVLDGLARSGDKQVVSVLEVLANDNDAAVRWSATLLMIKLDEPTGMARLERALQRPPEDFLDQILAQTPSLRDKLLIYLLKNKEQRLRAAGLDGLLLLGAQGLDLRRQTLAESFPADVRQSAVEVSLGLSSDKDLALFQRMAQAGSEDEKGRAIEWLHRKANPALAGFFRTMKNGAKDNPALQMAALYGLLRAQR